TEGMRDGSDAIADWPLLNGLLNCAAMADLVAIHAGGGGYAGYMTSAGSTVVADGTAEADLRLSTALTADTGLGVLRYADAGIEEIPDDGIIVTVTAIGSPAAPSWQMFPRDYVRALQLLMDALGQPVAGLITAQNGSSTTLNGWTQSALLGMPVIDAAGNGRA